LIECVIAQSLLVSLLLSSKASGKPGPPLTNVNLRKNVLDV
jgi:hypothetical protein